MKDCTRVLRLLTVGVVLVLTAAPAAAQSPQPASGAESPSPWRPLRIAKWSVTAAAAGAAMYGFLQNREADRAYEALEQSCQADWDLCLARTPRGAYADPGMEAQYQRVRSLDGRARTSLIAGQIGVATGVVLFLIDLRNQQPPSNIPYEPNRIELGPSRDGGFQVGVRLPGW